MLVVTTDSVPGFEVRSVFGEVVGITARTYNPYIEGVKSLNGRLNPELLRLLTQIRQEAVARMVEAAKQFGANAIVGMRFDVRGVTAAWNEVCAYGTAVLLMPVGGGDPQAQPSLNPMSISAIEGDAVSA
jgi:uncharacterized protein YbjQ (UPF0145 family)